MPSSHEAQLMRNRGYLIPGASEYKSLERKLTPMLTLEDMEVRAALRRQSRPSLSALIARFSLMYLHASRIARR